MQIFKEQLLCKIPLNIWRTLFGGNVMKMERKIVTLRRRRRLGTIGLRHITNINERFRWRVRIYPRKLEMKICRVSNAMPKTTLQQSEMEQPV